MKAELCLGVESTAHTLGLGIAKGNKILANELSMYKPKFSGIHPRVAAEKHSKEFTYLLKKVLEKSKVKPQDIDLIAFSMGPGLGPCLKVGCIAAKTLALELDKPILGVNHCIAHIEISKRFCNFKDPLVVYVSGGNTQLLVKEKNRYRVLGETLDIGLGNLLDSFGRAIGLEYAHGSVIEKLAKQGKYIELSYTVKGMDMSFTGLLTDAVSKIKNEKKEDLCYSLQEHAYSMLLEATERALVLTGKKELIVSGGVAQNKRLQEMLTFMCNEHKAKFGVAPNEYNADNGAMIAHAGLLMYNSGSRLSIKDAKARQRYRTDEVVVTW